VFLIFSSSFRHVLRASFFSAMRNKRHIAPTTFARRRDFHNVRRTLITFSANVSFHFVAAGAQGELRRLAQRKFVYCRRKFRCSYKARAEPDFGPFDQMAQ